MSLDDNHREYLIAHAITPDTIERTGIHSVDGEIVFPWTDGELITRQRRPWPGESGQYFWEEGKSLHFWNLRDAGPTSPVLVVEGTKQSLACASYAEARYSVLGMAGCLGWMNQDLSRFAGRQILLALDADAATNLDVWEAGEQFRTELEFYGVDPAMVKFIRLPAQGKSGMDDVLAKKPDHMRQRYLSFLAERAADKPADKRPGVRKGRRGALELPDTGGRPGVAVNLDRKLVIDKITKELKEAHDGTRLFNFGDVMTTVRGESTVPLDRDTFAGLLADTVATFHYKEATDKAPAVFTPQWPDQQTMGAVLSKADAYAPLRRMVRVPFLRPDGTVCFTPGYDRETATILVSKGLEDVAVPDAPSQDDTRSAAKFLMDEWLGDLPFKTDADRANALAMVLTPFMRGVVPLSPLGVVSGLQMGVGKNLLADCIALVATGEDANPLPYSEDDEEMRKLITSAFSSGADLFVFDEAHVIQGRQFARALTSLTYNDRILGSTRIAKFPNSVTWMSLGNQVQVNGDLSRRVYFVYLHPLGRNIIDREASSFRHPDLKAWTRENRPALVSAALTVLRGWYAAGRPAYSRGQTMGSFEPWDRLMSGVLAYAGFPAFLTDARERRSESDFATAWWTAHVHWLHRTFGGQRFTTRKVQEAILRNPADAETPPGLDKVTEDGWTRRLGQAYSSHRDREFNGVRLIKAGAGHASTNLWTTVSDDDEPGQKELPSGGEGGNGGNFPNPHVGKNTSPSQDAGARARVCGRAEVPSAPSVTSTPVQPSGTVGFDLETAAAGKLYHGGHEGPFIRLAGAIGDNGVPLVGAHADVPGLLDALDAAGTRYGHNVLAFDLPALARHAGADLDALSQGVVDTLVLARLADPPGAKGMKPWSNKGYYSLDAVAARLDVAGKTADLRALALEFVPEGTTDASGRPLTEKERAELGYERIPVDDPRYRDYLQGDLKATRAVFERLTAGGLSDYARREMRVEWLKNRMTFNGWAVDTDLLARRVREEDDRRAAAVKLLAGYGMPLARPDRYKLKRKADIPPEVWTSAAALRAVVAEDGPAAVAMGIAERIPGEKLKAPWASPAAKDALVKAFRDAGAEFVPRTESGDLAMSSDAMGTGFWIDHTNKRRPGMRNPAAYGGNPEVEAICEAIVLATGATAKYAEIQRWTTPEGRVHPENSAPQASGRSATVHPAGSNLGARGAAREQRGVFVSEPGFVLMTVDLSQVDMRAMAGLSQDPAYMALFEPGRDAHMEMAEQYFGERTPEARQKTKEFNHGGNYGQGPAAVAEHSGLPVDLCYELARRKAEAFPRLMEYIGEVRDLASTGALLDNGFGRMMRPDPARAYTQGPALMGQGAARDIMWESILRLVDAEPDVTPYLRGVVHDELVVSVPEAETERWSAALHDACTWEWRGVPILCEVSNPGRRWTECEH